MCWRQNCGESYECKSKLNIAGFFLGFFPFFSVLVVNGSVACTLNHVSVSVSLSVCRDIRKGGRGGGGGGGGTTK